MVVYDQPTPVTNPVDNAESCRPDDRFAVAAILGECVGPSVDGNVPVNANPLLTQGNLVRRRNGLENVEVVTNSGRTVTERRRPRASQDRFRVI